MYIVFPTVKRYIKSDQKFFYSSSGSPKCKILVEEKSDCSELVSSVSSGSTLYWSSDS